jgi:hypothetical protein
MTYIDEGNLYRLIIKSRKPEAEKFESWVCDEVLPSIRKTGRYQAEQPKPQVEYLSREQENGLSYAINQITSWFQFEKAWRHAVWFALRSATGRGSPERFLASDLPVLAAELTRIWGTASSLRYSMMEAEKEIIRRVVRGGEEGAAITDQIHLEMMGVARSEAISLTYAPDFNQLLHIS